MVVRRWPAGCAVLWPSYLLRGRQLATTTPDEAGALRSPEDILLKGALHLISTFTSRHTLLHTYRQLIEVRLLEILIRNLRNRNTPPNLIVDELFVEATLLPMPVL